MLLRCGRCCVKVREDKTFVAKLANGVDGEITENDYKPGGTTDSPTGLAAFDGFDVQIIGVTEYHSLSMAKVLHAYCKEQKNAIGICNLPLNADEGTAELYAMESRLRASVTCVAIWDGVRFRMIAETLL